VKEEQMAQEKKWTYNNFQIKEGMKPQAAHLQYFFVVSQEGKKKCSYCVWVDDEVLGCCSDIGNHEEVAASKREEWSRWVKRKIDKKDFRNLVLKIDKTGQSEINLSEMKEKLTFE